MAQTFEHILAQAFQLPALERQKLIEALARAESDLGTLADNEIPGEASPPAQPESNANGSEKALGGNTPLGGIISVNEPCIDRTQEYEWMRQHERDYIGQWVALKGNRLIAHGAMAKEVFAKARELGAPDALVYLVEDPDLHYVGF